MQQRPEDDRHTQSGPPRPAGDGAPWSHDRYGRPGPAHGAGTPGESAYPPPGATAEFPPVTGPPTGGYPAGAGGQSMTAPGSASGGPASHGPGRRPAGALVAGGLALALVSAAIGGAVGGYVASRDSGSGTAASSESFSVQPVADAPDGTVQAVANKVLPSVVDIQVLGARGEGSGSGVVLSEDGLILTNNHVVAAGGGGPAEYLIGFSDGQTAPATVVAADPASDMAVLRTERTGLTPIEIGASDTLTVGQPVVAIGSPLGLAGTVTTGIISAMDRPVMASGRGGDQATVIDALQTDAAINPGNSGGALVNMDGRLVGINTAIATLGGQGDGTGSIGLGFAIPIDQAMRIANQLVETGRVERAQIGVSVPSYSEVRGAEVLEVVPGGPADEGGIEQGSVIVRVGDRAIDSGDGLIAAVRSHDPGDEIEVAYIDPDGQEQTTTVTLATAE